MKDKILSFALSVAVLASSIPASANGEAADADKHTETIQYTYSAGAGLTYTREMERLNRGLIAVKSGTGVYLSWRLLDSEDARFGSAKSNVSFNIYRNDKKVASVDSSTNYTDSLYTAGTTYAVAPVINGTEGEKCEAVGINSNSYFDIPLVKPANEIIDEGGTPASKSFFPTDCSTGDLDGDGEYEIVVKWVSQECDVGNGGYSGTVRLAAYKLDGTRMWTDDIALGKNVYSSAHTVQFLVYDFDGDGKAEITSQTSLGSKDANGVYVSHSAKDDSVVVSTNKKIAEYTDEENETADFNGYDRKITGEEFLTIFSGETGAAIDTIDLPTARGSALGVDYGDNFGNRSNRFLADVAYLDGVKPYAVYMRGYYFGKNGKQRTSIAGISFDGERLSPDYRFDTKAGQPGYYSGAAKYVGQGNHNCSVADVDNDGKDEFLTGALCMEVKDDGTFKPRWCTFKEHGDALHIGDYDPTHPGFEFFTVHEDGNDENQAGPDEIIGTDDDYGYIQTYAPESMGTVICNFGMSVIDGDTGNILYHRGSNEDTGRGVMANTGAGGYYQFSGSANVACYGNGVFKEGAGGTGSNFRVFWDGDLYDELLDGTSVTSWNGSRMSQIFSASGCTKINGTKANPSLQADLFGDWREELVYPTTDGNNLRVYTTTTPTNYKIKTLMHDPVYRSGVAAQQTAYNQPPHVGMYLADELFAPDILSIKVDSSLAKTVYVKGEALDRTGLTVTAYYNDGTFADVNAYTLSPIDTSVIGEQTITVTYMGKTTEYTVTVKSIDHIEIESPTSVMTVYKGEALDTKKLSVKVIYNDGTSVPITTYDVFGFNTKTLGTKTVTVSYMEQSAKFQINVIEPDITILNKSYITDTAQSVSMALPIGTCSGDFTIEHSVTINSMPADGAADKNDTRGFFMRFMGDGQSGGGWYLSKASDTLANVIWKNTKTSAVGKIELGKTYKFRYEFKNVGVGTGASVTLSILDENGNNVASAANLNLRNFSDTDTGKASPITKVEIFNQANSGSYSDIVFNNAVAYGASKITAVNESNITLDISGTASGIKLFAAKYAENGALESIEIISGFDIGENRVSASFVPDKVFLWADMLPIDSKTIIR